MQVRVVVKPDEILTAADLGLEEDDATEAAVQAAVQFLDGPYGYLGASLGVQTIETSYDGWCEPGYYMLPQGPVISVESVQYRDTSDVLQTVDPASYRLSGDRLIFTSSAIYGTAHWTAIDAVVVTYKAGYDGEDPPTGTGELPAPIKQAVAIIAMQMKSTATAVAGDSLKSVEIPGVMTKTYGSWASSAGGQNAIQSSIRNLVAGYIRKTLIW